tara:strand:- start:78592 stop:80673 length:2082 start_codon:yes stop_codon:yes gene_type:complete
MNKNNNQQGNRLAGETSPYLLQHAFNPVNWYPWGEEALEKAKTEDIPIMLSIGYSACHWCHVMAHESFENEEIAALMNQYFVNIKIDREERPDLDDIYMNAVTTMTGSGGWPMTVFLTPELKPFYGGTYFPPKDQYGRPGFPQILKAVSQFYHQRRSEAEMQGDKLVERLVELNGFTLQTKTLDIELLDRASDGISASYDDLNGGFGTSPKFPPSMTLSFLLRDNHRTGRKSSLDIVVNSLKKMAKGGIYDHLGGGFHRYSVDEKWLIPHFEKMLYDNALLLRTYTEAFQATGEPLFRNTVTETGFYIIREMLKPNGGFYATQDADSEGEEGKFYVWTPGEIQAILGEERSTLFTQYYGVDDVGNFEHGASVLHQKVELEALADSHNLDPEELWSILGEDRCKLLNHREKRIKPGRDEKIMTDWNGLMIGSLARASRIFAEPLFLDSAVDSINFILKELYKDGRMLHVYKDGRAKFNGYLDDYVFTISALLDLYEATFDLNWFLHAVNLMDRTLEQFWDSKKNGFFYTSNDHEKLIVRPKTPYDNAIPSGNAIAIHNLLRLATFTGKHEYREKAELGLSLFSDYMATAPGGFGQLLSGLDWFLDTPVEIAIIGSLEDPRTQAMLKFIDHTFLPNKVLAVQDISKPESNISDYIPLLANKKAIGGVPTTYVCKDFVCQNPVTTVEELARLLKKS